MIEIQIVGEYVMYVCGIEGILESCIHELMSTNHDNAIAKLKSNICGCLICLNSENRFGLVGFVCKGAGCKGLLFKSSITEFPDFSSNLRNMLSNLFTQLCMSYTSTYITESTSKSCALFSEAGFIAQI